MITEAVLFDRATLLLSCLSNEVRLRAILKLCFNEWSVSDLATDLNVSQSAMSQHLGKLRAARLVQVRRNKQTIFYRCTHAAVIAVLRELHLVQQPPSADWFGDSGEPQLKRSPDSFPRADNNV